MHSPTSTTESRPTRCEACGNSLAVDLGWQCPRCLLGLAVPAGPDDGSAPPPTLIPEGRNRRFGDYELLEEIARGGMGVVFRARQVSLNREVALKMILAGELAGPESLRMFQREAHAAANLHHPNIVPVYEIGEHEMQHYFTLRLVPGGRTIANWAASRRGHWRELAGAVAKAARAVAFAHNHGVLHRDLKPSNILWDDLAGPQVTDFGLAKLLDESDGSVTLSARVFGSPNYMAPEQAGGRNAEITTATDVYGLGAVFYELLSGRPPFRGTSALDTLRRVSEEAPAPLPDVPADLRTICFKCLEKEPARRYRSAAALADDLERWLRNEPIAARPAGTGERVAKWVRRRPAHAALVATAALALVALIVGQSVHTRRTNAARRAAEEASRRLAGELRRVEWLQAEEALAAGRTPDAMATFARFLRETPDDTTAAGRLRSLLELRAFPLPLLPPLKHGAPVRHVRLDANGRHLFTIADDGKLRRWSLDTGALEREADLNLSSDTLRLVDGGRCLLLRDRDGGLLIWNLERWQLDRVLARSVPSNNQFGVSPDGHWLSVVSADGEVRLLNVADGTLRARAQVPAQNYYLTPVIGPQGETLVRGLALGGAWLWRPEQDSLRTLVEFGTPTACAGWNWRHRLAYTFLGDEGESVGTAVLFDLETGRELSRHPNIKPWHAVRDSPDGESLLVYRWGHGFAVLNSRTMAPRLPWQSAAPCRGNVSPDQDFRVGFHAPHDGTGRLYDLTTGEPMMEPVQHEGRIVDHELSPDGRRLVTGSEDGSARLWDLRMRAGEDSPIRSRYRVHHAALSSDAAHVVLATARHVEIHPLDGSSPPIVPAEASDVFTDVGFSPDTGRISAANSDRSLRVIEARSGTTLWRNRDHNHRAWRSRFSPNGASLASAGEDGTVRVYDAATGTPRFPALRHAQGVAWIRFSPDGRRLASASFDTTARIWDAATGQALGPPLRHKGTVGSVEFSSDGTTVLTASADRTAQLWNVGTGEPVAPPIRTDQGLMGAKFSTDGRQILVFGLKGARIYDAARSTPITAPMPHHNRVIVADFSPDGRWVGTGSEDGTARIWDARTGFPVTEPLLNHGQVHCLMWLPDSRQLLTASEDNQLRRWTLPDLGASPAWLPDLAEALAGKRNEPHGGSIGVATDRLDALRQRAVTAGDSPDLRWLNWFLVRRLASPNSRPDE